MPDSFFSSSKPRKRKRTETGTQNGSVKKFARKGSSVRGGPKKAGVTKKRRVDEELSDKTDEEDEGIEDMDLRGAMDVDPAVGSGDEDEDETPAAKRLRLAKLYLESVKEGLGM